jgi:hypothetical protein
VQNLERSLTYMPSFGRILKKMRRSVSLVDLSERTGYAVAILEGIELRRMPANELQAREILARGFSLERADVDRLILGLKLYELGLKDNDFRLLTIDVIRDELPIATRDAIRKLYLDYLASIGPIQ